MQNIAVLPRPLKRLQPLTNLFELVLRFTQLRFLFFDERWRSLLYELFILELSLYTRDKLFEIGKFFCKTPLCLSGIHKHF